MLQSISAAFQSDRCLLLGPEKIIEDGFLSRLVSEKKPLWVEEGSSFRKENVLPEEEGFLCPAFACIPLYDETSFQGMLYLGFSKPYRFSPQEVELLLLVGEAMVGTIRNDHLHQKAEETISELTATHYEISNMAQENEKRVAQLSSLWEFNKALLTTVNFERILQLTLMAITIGEGLKFNRAMLFLVNEKNRTLEGAIAVGPDSAEEAGRIWAALSQRKGPLSEQITQLNPQGHSALNAIVKGIQIPLEQEQCILSRTVLEGKPFNIPSSQSKEGGLQTQCERGCHLGSEVGCYVGEHLSRDPKVYSFATVPLMGKGGVIGVILVDNLYNQNPITEEDIHFLSMFSNQAGLAIENAILYRNLEEVHQELKETQNLMIHREKMVALGELSNSIAHEIKNPLVSIGGFARRLYRAIPDDAMEKRYTQTIMIEVARLENILTDIFNYTHDESIAFKECNLRKILEDSLSMTHSRIEAGGVKLVKEFHEEIPQIHGDYHQLMQVFSNLINNAYQSMKGDGILSLRLHSIAKNGASYVRVEVEDTGGGIDPQNLHNIFNPFYTTKDSSLGLGLPIVHKIITSHRGQIEVDNQPGIGVNFIITLPASEKGRENRLKGAEADQ